MKSKYFKLYELLPKELYVDEEKGWDMIDAKLIETLDKIRGMLGVPLICNNWYWGGSRNYCGYRPKDCKIGAKFSQHKQGNAVDLISKKMTAEQMRKIVIENQNKLPYNIRIERGVSWFHFDLKNMGVKVYQFNP